MLTLERWLQVLAVCLLGVVCTCALPSLPGYPDDSLHYRDEEEAYSDPDKPVRDDGLGSLLLKNLRFRDLSNELHRMRPAMLKALAARQHYQDSSQESREFNKRGDMSVNELAKILNNLKARNVDGGVKLQSLRFGRKR